MSRIGRKPIQIPEKVSVVVGEDLVEVSGPRGKIYQKIMIKNKIH